VIALVDGDIIAYTIAAGCEDYDDKTAISKCSEYLEDLVYIHAGCDDADGWLTGYQNFRTTVAKTKPYKGTRTQEKPKHLELLRTYLNTAWNFSIEQYQEADDALGIAAYSLDPEEYVICTTDKDLNMIRGWHYNFRKNEKFWIDEDETLYNFYTQVLTGDRTDNVPGLKGVGPKKAEKILKGCKTEYELYDAVLKAYDNDEEYLTEQATLLWIRRKPNQVWKKPR
jgi:hypothetical protein